MEGMIQNPGGAGLTASAPASFASLRSSAYSRLPANSARTHCCDFSPVEQAIKKKPSIWRVFLMAHPAGFELTTF